MKIIKIPHINALGKTKGCEEAPDIICQNLKLKNLSTEVKINKNNLEESNHNIYAAAEKAFKTNERTIFLGGDHSISYATVKAFFESYRNAGLVVFDAHIDCMHNFKPPTHEDWLRVLLEEKFVNSENVILIGTRKIYKEEKDFLKKQRLKIVKPNKLSKHKLLEIFDFAKKHDSIYISIDIDVLDPKVANAVAYPVKNGVKLDKFMYLLNKITKLKNFKALDLVEYIPKRDKNKITLKAILKIVNTIKTT